MLVDFESDRVHSVHATIVNQKVRARVVALVVDNGGPREEAAFVPEHDVREYFTAGQWQALMSGWTVRKRLDSFVALNFYGYDATTLAE